MFDDATPGEVAGSVQRSAAAFAVYKKLDLKSRAGFLYAVADELQQRKDTLIRLAQRETNLDETRLLVEFRRTVFQLTSYADACAEGAWLDARIDTADRHRNPPKPDLRKMLVPLGPVVVFGASNFPFAYSTAGGDTACALAAGCTVVVKAHPAHAHTSQTVAEAIKAAAKKQALPEAVFIHLHGASFEVGKALVQHPLAKAVAFTGSFEGGKALFDLAAQRNEPIPVFAEMGSVNPVFLLPQKLQNDAPAIAALLANSITQSAGQFCTNPGLMIGVQSDALTIFCENLAEAIRRTPPARMLHAGIAKSFHAKRSDALAAGIALVASGDDPGGGDESIPTLTRVPAQRFLATPLLHKEVFGPYSLLVECAGEEEMKDVVRALEGQLTGTVIGTEEEIEARGWLLDALAAKCGRLILNGVPTGVEVALAMAHGGPYPATTDSRFTAVGADGIKRFARPLCFQNWPDNLLPDALKDHNPLGLWRTVNNALTKDAAPHH